MFTFDEVDMRPRHVVWFSCGAASAVLAKKVLEMRRGKPVVVVYCDTSKNEHPDNHRFLKDVEGWLGTDITKLRSEKYQTVEEVFAKKRYMSGPRGACCTVELKKVPRFGWQRSNDIHYFGFTLDEQDRIVEFENNNHELLLQWPLRDLGISKKDCYRILSEEGIRLPEMYLLGYRNNNCLGCVKSTSPGYWAKIRKDFPEVFRSRCEQSRLIGCRLLEIHKERKFLDELPELNEKGKPWRYKGEDLSCGPECRGGAK